MPSVHYPLPSIERPHSSLMTYYAIQSLVAGPLFFILLIPLYFRYHTMRYRFDGQGVTMRWGVLFRREISLTYSRLQDIHLTSNVIERWLGLARIQLQTASGSAEAEITLEGIREFEPVRDALYLRMRGAAGPTDAPAPGPASAAGGDSALAAALHAVADELAAVRRALEHRLPPAHPPASDPR